MNGAVPEIPPQRTPQLTIGPDQAGTASALEKTSSALLLAHAPFRDQFLERRFIDNGTIDLKRLSDQGQIAPLSKSDQTDEMYDIPAGIEGLTPGMYRIRTEGEAPPFITLKKHGNGRESFTETIDLIHPDEGLVDKIRNHGRLCAVIEKSRVTYKSRIIPNCLIHTDEVKGLGKFIDVKGDTSETLQRFIEALGLPDRLEINRSYLALTKEAGISELQLKAWKFHQRFQDYILGVVSGCLTPMGFLSATLVSGQTKTWMVTALLSCGFCDGTSDAVAAAQTTQSGSRATMREQALMFGKTLLGKVIIPSTFVPFVIGFDKPLAIGAATSLWAATLLSLTAAVQALANRRSPLQAIGKLLFWGACAVGIGSTLGKVVPELLPPIIEFFRGKD